MTMPEEWEDEQYEINDQDWAEFKPQFYTINNPHYLSYRMTRDEDMKHDGEEAIAEDQEQDVGTDEEEQRIRH